MNDSKKQSSLLEEAREAWPRLNVFERIEYVVTLIVMALISVIIVVALVRLGKNIYAVLLVNAFGAIEFTAFQGIFGNILTLFIAMEFRHSMESVLEGKGHIIQVRTILLIAMLAIARKFIVMDKTTSPEAMAALALILLSIAVTYWIMKRTSTRE